MKKYIFAFLTAATFALAGCGDILDRPQLDKPQDDNFWRNETDLRLFSNGFYPNYFVGYNSSWSVPYAPLRGYNFSDDYASAGKQASFENTVPSSRGSSKEEVAWLDAQNPGSNWNFSWVRKANLFIDRIETVAKPQITDGVYKHWMSVGRFFRGYEYCRLVNVFGDVPYFDKIVSETDVPEMFKDRSPRIDVMEKVYADFQYVMENMRLDDGVQNLNRYIAAGFISRFMLFEGTWQNYHNGDKALAKKYLEMSRDAANLVISSNKWEISGEFRGLFGAQDLKGHKEVLMYRHYDAALGITHAVASYSNGQTGQSPAPNLALAKAFLCNDGRDYTNSGVENAEELDVYNMVKTRDPRFEATFDPGYNIESATLLYATKFIDRVGPSLADPGSVAIYGSVTNTNDYPVMRYSEIILNFIEAKAELAENFGGAAVSQADIDLSINALRSRPLAAAAVAQEVKKTDPMVLANVNDAFAADRDQDVAPLIWEIRRERRMEFVFEHSRVLDLKRWKKLHYMDNAKYPATKLGLWVNLKKDVPAYLEDDKKRQVMKEDMKTIVTYDGTNADDMVGFYVPLNASNRDSFTDRSYCAPVGRAQINQYAEKGYTLTQTNLW